MTSIYRVTAPYVTVKVRTRTGNQILGFYKDAILPEGVDEASLNHHLNLGMLEQVEAPAAAEVPPRVEDLQPPPPSAPQDEEPEGDGGEGEEGAAAPPVGPIPATPPTAGPGSSKSAWVDYAVARGMNREDAAAKSRDELIAAYKED